MTRSQAGTRPLRTIALLTLACFIPSSTASGTVSLSLEKRFEGHDHQIPGRRIYKRAVPSTVESVVYGVWPWSSGGAYYTNVSVGTPPQTLTVILDTGSSDLYVDASHAQACQDKAALDSCRGGAFDVAASTTYKTLQRNAFNASYGDGSMAAGDFGSDLLGLGNIQLSEVQLGLASIVNSTVGYAVSLLGIGYPQLEAPDTKYPNVPDLLKKSEAINSRLYSVFLNNEDDKSGNILFGGIDTSKYNGTLHTLNLLPTVYYETINSEPTNLVYQFVVAVTGLKVNSPSGSSIVLANGDAAGQDLNRSLPALLDTGSASWTVPTAWAQTIYDAFGGAISEDGTLPCSYRNEKVSLEIEFGGKVSIHVPARSLLAPYYDPVTNQQMVAKDEPLCILAVTPDQEDKDGNSDLTQRGFLTLGDSILREMYVVFDMDNGQVSIAQASWDAPSDPSDASVKVVEAGPSGVAKAISGSNGGHRGEVPNPNAIGATLSVTRPLSLATAASAVGTATGTDAVPLEARVTLASKQRQVLQPTGAASMQSPPPIGVSASVISAIWLSMASLGVAIIL